jgi:MFS transporter, SHS family, sialic acid transporter
MTQSDSTPVDLQVSNVGKWMALFAALLGWLFDGLEMGLFPLVQKEALKELLESGQNRDAWIGIITALFLIGAATGGVLFGWLGDRIGRVRAMMLSVLTYAVFSGMCGFASSAWQVGVLRSIAALGMGGEWALGVALINELWPNRSRAFLAGLIGAAANIGYLLIAAVGIGVIEQAQSLKDAFLSAGLPDAWVEQLFRNEAWRFMMMIGAVPALLTLFIRAFVPESTRWQRAQQRGTTSNWMSKDLFGVLLGAIGACALIALWTPGQTLHLGLRIFASVLCLIVIASGYTYPAIRFLQRAHAKDSSQPTWRPTLRRMLVAACLSGVALLGTWGSTQQAPTFAADTAKADAEKLPVAERSALPPAAGYTQIAASVGAIIGTILAALMGDWLGRRFTYCIMCLGSLIIIPVFYLTPMPFGVGFLILAWLLGAITAAFYGWFPLFLPELFPTALRATGQGFGYNFGRVLAAVGVLQMGNLKELFGGHLPNVCSALSVVYLAGLILIWFVPETKGKPLPD